MEADDRAAGLLLAAGAGVRLGTPKALVGVGGEPLVVRGARTLAAAGCRPCVVVAGARADDVQTQVDIADLPADADVRVIVAPEWASGQAHSLRAGLEHLGQVAAPAVVVALVDQPLVTPAAIERLVLAWRSGAQSAVSTYDGQRRPPVLLDAQVWPEVTAALHGDDGAGPWLEANAHRTTGVEVGDVADGRDVDTPEELAAVNLMVVGRRPWP